MTYTGIKNMNKPFDLQGLKTYDLASRPSKVFKEDLGKPLGENASVADLIDSLPNQLAGKTELKNRIKTKIFTYQPPEKYKYLRLDINYLKQMLKKQPLSF